MKPKHEILNEIIEKNGYEKYLEIGVGEGYNFNRIKVDSAHGVEPKGSDLDMVVSMSSDDFFKEEAGKYDIIFIDGDHTAEQARKDIINAMRFLEEDGVIVLHDTIPHNESMQKVPREQKEWTGDVYKAVVGFHVKYPEIKLETFRADYGISVLHPKGKKVRAHFEKECKLTYEEFKKDEVNLLNIID